MTKAQLIQAVAAKTGMTQKEVDAALSATIEVLTDALKEGDKVRIAGLGTFSVKTRAEHQGRNPYTGEAITVPESRYLSFSVSKTLKDQL